MGKVHCCYLLLFFPFFVFSQKNIIGTVKNKKGEALLVNVLVSSKGSMTILGFSTTNKNGEYNLTYKQAVDSITVTVTGMGIGKHQKTVSANEKIVNFSIEENGIEIKEVSVFSSRIVREGDTLNYYVNSYIDQNDRVIGDVLKKLPGINVSSSGSISYRGKAINKFYIENMDMLQGRYGIATNNIPAKDVSTVQILENHQPIRVLQNTTFSDAAAINIKLKDSAKGTLALTSMLGIGYKPWGWNTELVAMYFKKNMQDMSTYKSNNVGEDLKNELKSHYDGERLILSPTSMLSIQEPNTPPIPLKRYYDNNSHAVAVNHLSKLKDSLELVTNIAYLYDYEKKQGYSMNQLYLPENNQLLIEENMISKRKSHNLGVSFKLNTNRRNYYINNYLTLSGNFEDMKGFTNSKTDGLNEFINQKLKSPSLGIDNAFNLIKNIGTKTYSIYWSTAYMHKPHDLTITPAYYFNSDSLYALRQEYSSNRFSTNLRTSYLIRHGYFKFDYTLWMRLDMQKLKTELQGIDKLENIMLSADSLNNDLTYNNYTAGLSQSYSYEGTKLKATIGIPAYYYILRTKESYFNRKKRYDKLIINPSFSLNFLVSHELQMKIAGSYNKSFGDINFSYPGYIMHNYRNFLRNTNNDLFNTQYWRGGLFISYANAFDALFINLEGNYTNSKNNMLYGYDYYGIMSVRTLIDKSTGSNGYNAKMSINKGLNFWSLTLRLNCNYNNSNSDILVQKEILKSNYEGYGAGVSVNALPVSLVGLQYSLSWNQGQNYVVGNSSFFPKIQTTIQTGKLNIFPTKQLTVSTNIEHQYNNMTSNKSVTFADIEIKYRYKSIDYELGVNNVFNAKQYISTSYNSINTYSYSYNLRPASVLLKLRFKLK